MKAALHQLVPRPFGFCGVILVVENVAFCALVNTLHCALVRLES